MATENVADRAESRNKNQRLDTDKVAKLVRLLGSDKDGEILAAVAALKRTLGAGGADLNDLAAGLVAGLKKPKRQQPTRWTPPAPDTSFWESMAWWAHYHRSRLSTSDSDYVHEVLMGYHFDCGRADASMMSRLRNIVAKVKAAPGAEDRW
jgi:hypothetical protein